MPEPQNIAAMAKASREAAQRREQANKEQALTGTQHQYSAADYADVQAKQKEERESGAEDEAAAKETLEENMEIAKEHQEEKEEREAEAREIQKENEEAQREYQEEVAQYNQEVAEAAAE